MASVEMGGQAPFAANPAAAEAHDAFGMTRADYMKEGGGCGSVGCGVNWQKVGRIAAYTLAALAVAATIISMNVWMMSALPFYLAGGTAFLIKFVSIVNMIAMGALGGMFLKEKFQNM